MTLRHIPRTRQKECGFLICVVPGTLAIFAHGVNSHSSFIEGVWPCALSDQGERSMLFAPSGITLCESNPCANLTKVLGNGWTNFWPLRKFKNSQIESRDCQDMRASTVIVKKESVKNNVPFAVCDRYPSPRSGTTPFCKHRVVFNDVDF